MHAPATLRLPVHVYAQRVNVTAGDDETIEYGVAEAVWKQLTRILRARIRAGQYQPRRAVPSEKQIEQEFGVARGTARKAIGQLRAEGLVVTVAGRGSYVADPLPGEDES